MAHGLLVAMHVAIFSWVILQDNSNCLGLFFLQFWPSFLKYFFSINIILIKVIAKICEYSDITKKEMWNVYHRTTIACFTEGYTAPNDQGHSASF